MFLRLFLLCGLLFPMSIPASAQRALGFRFGINVAGVAGDLSDKEAFSTRTGFVAGLFGTIPLRYSLAIQPELLYTQKGFSTESATLNGTGGEAFPADFELTYLEVPLLVKYGLPVSSTAMLHLYAGPTLSFELSERVALDELQGSQEIDQFRSQDVGVALGGEVSLPVSAFDAMLGVRFTRSVCSALNRDVGSSDDVRVFNEVLSFTVGVYL